MEEKKAIRKQVFAARKAHTDQQIDDWSRKIAETVTALPEYSNSRRILAYADYNHEVMTKYIIEAAWNDGKEVAVPKVVGQDMVFYKLTDFAQLEKGYFGIPEPARGEIVQYSFPGALSYQDLYNIRLFQILFPDASSDGAAHVSCFLHQKDTWLLYKSCLFFQKKQHNLPQKQTFHFRFLL